MFFFWKQKSNGRSSIGSVFFPFTIVSRLQLVIKKLQGFFATTIVISLPFSSNAPSCSSISSAKRSSVRAQKPAALGRSLFAFAFLRARTRSAIYTEATQTKLLWKAGWNMAYAWSISCIVADTFGDPFGKPKNT